MSEPDWNTLYTQLLPQVYNYFRYRVSDQMLAEDLTATTFKRAWQSRGQYRADIAGFSTWLFAIARRVAADHFRQHQQAEIDINAVPHICSDISPEAFVEYHEMVDYLRNLIRRLPEREQELIALRYGAGMDYQRIATITGINSANIRVILHRTVRKLREQVKVNDESAK